MSCTLRVAEIEDLWLSCKLFDLANLSLGIILAHFSPTVFPELMLVRRQSLVHLTVLGTTVVTEPYIEASIV